MKDFCVVGSGISGSTVAKLLSKKYSLEVFDKARGPGGRTSNKRYKRNLSFDHGLQYISPKNLEFSKFIKNLKRNKILKKWEGKHFNFSSRKKNTLIKYIGKKANNDICKFSLKKINASYYTAVKKINFNSNYWCVTLEDNKKIKFKSIILTMPYPQIKTIAKNYLNKSFLNMNVKMNPGITVLVVYKGNTIPLSSIKFKNSFIEWAANENSKKRFKSNVSLWTIQTNSNWAKKFINKYKNNQIKTTNIVLNEFSRLTGINNNDKIFDHIHGWKYSFSSNKTNLKSYWSKKYRLGVCGDWFLGPKAEHAWLSANDLYKKIKKNPLIIK